MLKLGSCLRLQTNEQKAKDSEKEDRELLKESLCE